MPFRCRVVPSDSGNRELEELEEPPGAGGKEARRQGAWSLMELEELHSLPLCMFVDLTTIAETYTVR